MVVVNYRFLGKHQPSSQAILLANDSGFSPSNPFFLLIKLVHKEVPLVLFEFRTARTSFIYFFQSGKYRMVRVKFQNA